VVSTHSPFLPSTLGGEGLRVRGSLCLPPIPSLRAVFWRGNLAEGGKGMHLFLPSPLEDVWGSKSPRVCREVNRMRLVRRSLYCSVGGGGVSNLTKNGRRNDSKDKRWELPLYVIPDLIRNLVFTLCLLPAWITLEILKQVQDDRVWCSQGVSTYAKVYPPKFVV